MQVIIVTLTYFGVELETECDVCTGLDHTLVVACGVTQIPAEGSGCERVASRAFSISDLLLLEAMNNIFHIVQVVP